MKAAQGMVRTQAITMRWPQIHRTERTPRTVPTPRMEPVIAWVVEIGTPRILVKPKMVKAAAVSAQKPPTGERRVMPEPIVLTMRQPPKTVPRAIAAWEGREIHQATIWSGPERGSAVGGGVGG